MKLWGGRFGAPTEKQVEQFTASIQFDWRLYEDDIAGSVAHCRMLARQGIISPDDARQIIAGLRQVYEQIKRGELEFRSDLEDIHTHVESRLRDLVGEVAGRLHTARSRNDQVALDLRMYARRFVIELGQQLVAVQSVLIDLAERHADWVMPGYTHLQRAQPIVLGHHLLAFREMLARDFARYRDAYPRVNLLPLGAGALAGVPYPIDRDYVASLLGFAGVLANSLDAVSDRDFALEIMAANAILMVHLSRLAEELILWSSSEFGFVEIDDRFATGSSIMPQKKNPDVAELIRGKAGRVYGDLHTLLTVMKGLPLSYNRDLQEDKEAFFDSADTCLACLSVLAPMLSSLKFNQARLLQTAGQNFSLATDYADYLVGKGIPFRQAHSLIGQMVAWCVEQSRTLESLSINELKHFSDRFDSDAIDINVDYSVNRRQGQGGTAPTQVRQAIPKARADLVQQQEWLNASEGRLPDVEELMSRPAPDGTGE